MSDYQDIGRLTRDMGRADERAWRCFHERFYDLIESVVRARGVKDSEAADVVQRAYLKILNNVKPFEIESDFRAWVCCIARSESIDLARKHKRRAGLLERFCEWAKVAGAPSTGRPMLEGMNADERRLLEKHYSEGWSQAELAAESGVSVKAMESRLARLRIRARAWLNEDGGFTQ